jgi:MFS family permease
MPISVLIAKVFRERRSLAFGIFRMGPGISGPLVPVIGWMIGLWGWRTAAAVSSVIIFAVGLPMAWFINRIYHQEEAAARAEAESESSAQIPRPVSNDPQFTLSEALRLKTFWFLSIAMALRHMVTEGVSVHFAILLVDRGWSMAAATACSDFRH